MSFVLAFQTIGAIDGTKACAWRRGNLLTELLLRGKMASRTEAFAATFICLLVLACNQPWDPGRGCLGLVGCLPC